MSSTRPAAQVDVGLDTDQARKDAKAFSNSLAETLTGIKSAVDLASQAFDFLGGMIKSVIGPAQEAERAQRALTTALRQQTSDYAAHVTRLGQYNKALQESVGIDDDALAQLQAKLSLLGVLPSELERATKATIGLAEITGEDLASAGTKVSKVLAGNIEALSKLGIKGRDIGDVLGKLDRGFEAAQERALTFEGRVSALNVAWESFKEEVGTAIIENPDVKQGMEDLRAWIKDITTTAENGKSKMGTFISETVSDLRTLVGFVNDNKDTFTTLLGIYGVMVVAGKVVSIAKGVAGVASAGAALAGTGVAGTTVGAAAAGGLGWAGLGLLPWIGLAALPNVQGNIFQSLMPPAAERPAFDAGASFSPAWGPDRNEVNFDAGEGVTIKGKGNAKDIEKARKEGLERWHKFEKAQMEKAFALDDMERERNLESLRAKREVFLAEEQLRVDARNSEADNAARRWEIQQSQIKADDDFNREMVSIGVGGMANFIAGITSNLIQGKLEIGALMGGLFGSLLSGVGSAMVGLGTAAVAAASATAPIPLLWPIFGGPMGVAGGVGLIAAGSILTGVGQGIAAASGGSGGASRAPAGAQSAATRAAGRSPSSSSAAPKGFVPGGSGATNVTNINISFAGSIATGTPRQIARSLTDILRQGGWSMQPGT